MIKKILLSLCVMLGAYIGNAQFKKGSILLGGDLSFNQEKNTGTSSWTLKNISLSPVGGFAIKENLFIGAGLTYTKTEYGYIRTVGTPSTTSSFGVTLFARRYKQIFGRFSAFIQGGLNANSGKQITYDPLGNELNQKLFNLNLGISPGISIPISKKIFLESGFSNIATIYYEHIRTPVSNMNPDPNASKTTRWGLSTNLSAAGNGLYFGFRIILPK